ncbi:MAG: hypothetical protein WEC54_03235 [Gemmatimonadales bacterium]
MRQSSTLLSDTPIRLWDLTFPGDRVHVHRTRLVYIHLENLLHFSKIDRDGRVDGYIAAWLPNEVLLLLIRGGEVITAVSMADEGRTVQPIAQALDRMRQEVERSDLAFIEASTTQLSMMYGACAGPLARRPVATAEPGMLFAALQHERFTGTLELISDGSVNYFRFQQGQFQDGYFCAKREDETVGRYVERLLNPREDGSARVIVATVFTHPAELPEQAPPALIETYRDLFWRIAEAAEVTTPNDAMKRAYRIRDALQGTHAVLGAIGVPRDRTAVAVVASPTQLTWALADWTLQLLEQLEVIAPGIAPAVLKEATREQRFVLQKAGFYQWLPWTVAW